MVVPTENYGVLPDDELIREGEEGIDFLGRMLEKKVDNKKVPDISHEIWQLAVEVAKKTEEGTSSNQ